jgi:hypothetical protein
MIADSGPYTVQYLVTETGVSPCTFIPHIRQFSLSVTKRPPSINYVIPDYNSLRAGVAFEINFPTDP